MGEQDVALKQSMWREQTTFGAEVTKRGSREPAVEIDVCKYVTVVRPSLETVHRIPNLDHKLIS